MNSEAYTCIHISGLSEKENVTLWARKGVQAGASGAEELENGVKLYFANNAESALRDFQELLHEKGVAWKSERIPEADWNRRWEENFQPIIIDEDLVIRAPFHPEFSDHRYRIEVLPERAFGTGHHPTTRLMLEALKKREVRDRKVLDMGCGTGILAIFCEMLGAESIHAFDNDSWAVQNSRETIERNGCKRISIEESEIVPSQGTSFDVILGNIQRGPLLRLIPHACEHLKKGGELLLSGLRKNDIPHIDKKCREMELVLEEEKEANKWFMLAYRKDS